MIWTVLATRTSRSFHFEPIAGYWVVMSAMVTYYAHGLSVAAELRHGGTAVISHRIVCGSEVCLTSFLRAGCSSARRTSSTAGSDGHSARCAAAVLKPL